MKNETPTEAPAGKTLSYAQHITDRARKALKAAGIKGVTVASRRLTYDRELVFTIRDPETSVNAVKAVAAEFDKVDRCHVSGEILCGGNCYVDVNFGPKVRDHAAALWEPVIRACAATLPPVGTNSGRRLEDRMTVFLDRPGTWKIWVEASDHGPWFEIWMGDALQNIYDASACMFERFGAPRLTGEERKEAA